MPTSSSSVARRASRLLGSLGIAGLLALASQTASAHAHLKAAEPAVDSTVAVAPRALVLHFTEALEANLSGVAVSGPGLPKAVAGRVAVDAADPATLTVALPPAMAPGLYHVKWHVVAVDGHRTQGDYTLTIK